MIWKLLLACRHIGDAATMLERAASRDLSQWGRADQALPELGASM